MPKLSKQYYYSSKGEKKLHCYKLSIPKTIINKSDINENDEIKISTKGGKIVLEKDEKEK